MLEHGVDDRVGSWSAKGIDSTGADIEASPGADIDVNGRLCGSSPSKEEKLADDVALRICELSGTKLLTIWSECLCANVPISFKAAEGRIRLPDVVGRLGIDIDRQAKEPVEAECIKDGRSLWKCAARGDAVIPPGMCRYSYLL
jgi:hypothetical protein|eukprot:jgi/Chrpa1/12155/Chrysochromulina_OHIO_Genome00005177-RA